MNINVQKRSLIEILKCKKKDELLELTYFYPIKGKSKLKKEELANTILEILTDEQTLIENTILLKAELSETEEDLIDITLHRKLIDMGYGRIITNDEGLTFILANEVDKILINLNKNINDVEINRYLQIRRYLLACVRLYGIVEKDFFVNLFNNLNPNEEPLDLNELNLQLNRCEKANLEACEYSIYVVSESLFMIEGEIEELLNQIEGKEYYIPTRQELLKYEDDYYIEKNSQYLQFEKFIHKKVKDEEKASGLVDDLAFVLRFEEANLNSAVNEFHRRGLDFDSLKEVEQFMKVYINLANNTRIWSNKGNTPEELRAENLDQTNKVVVGRNDPCPCNSGKKYKKCCLN